MRLYSKNVKRYQIVWGLKTQHVSGIRTDIKVHDNVDIEDCCSKSAEDASDSRAEGTQEAREVSKPEV